MTCPDFTGWTAPIRHPCRVRRPSLVCNPTSPTSGLRYRCSSDRAPAGGVAQLHTLTNVQCISRHADTCRDSKSLDPDGFTHPGCLIQYWNLSYELAP